jgi:hypothetical protein
MSYELPNGEQYTVIMRKVFESMNNSVLTRKKIEAIHDEFISRPKFVTERRSGREDAYFKKAQMAEKKFEELNNRFSKVKRLNQSLISKISDLKKQIGSFQKVLSAINRDVGVQMRNEELILIISDYEKLKAFNDGLTNLELAKLGLTRRRFKNLLYSVKNCRNIGCHPLALRRPCVKTIRPVIDKYLQQEPHII